ncbi:MAG: AarF/ABC1/UbiB kinase family protein [Synechococcales bacterium]|nr:AarF/ABC1/UbiB kinase family protein [Synechococcales bacterium]
MFSTITQTSSRQREILEVVLRNGWDYMRRLLVGIGKEDEPELPPPAVLRNVLIDLGPVYVKLGQLLSTRPDLLPPDYIDALSDLHANVPPVDWAAIEIVIRKELARPMEEVFVKIEPQAIAAGSVAQIHRATLRNGEEVAIKVQRPGIEVVVEQDISLIKGIADLVSRTNFGEYYDTVSLADEFASALRAELDFTEEATYTDRLRRNLSTSRWFDPDRVVVPAIVWDLTTPKMMVMQWLDGVPILKAELKGKGFNGDIAAERQAITTTIFRAFFQQFYIDGFFHADPHPGNLFYLNDGRVALLDCGMVGRLDPRTQGLLTEMVLAIVNSDAQRCSQLTIKLATPMRPVDLVRLESDYDYLLRKYYSLSLSELNFSQAFYEVLQAARKNYLRWPSNMGLYAKALANLEGLGRKFNPDVNLLDEVRPLVTDLFRRQLIGEDPVQALLRTSLELKNLSLDSPRRFEFLLDRLSSETFKWNLTLRDLDGVRLTIGDSANRLSSSIIVGSLIMGAAIITSREQTAELYWISVALFAAASLVGLWLLVSIVRSGRLK